jgi:two-component system sensor histidine kinase HydH
MGTLAAGMAHEIKNPLQTLKTFSQLLPERYDDPEFRGSFSELIGQEVQRIDALVSQLLRFARPARPHFAPVAAHDIIGHTLRLLRQQIRQRDVTLETQLQAASDAVSADADLLQQALVNLVLNALDAMDKGGRLTVTTDLHQTGRGARGRFFRITIRDTGPGIDAADLPRVFDPFFTTKSSGTGLGLSVSHGIVADHGGQLLAESKDGQGATFHLLLPMTAAEKAR